MGSTFDDAPLVEYDGRLYCYYNDDFWVWDKDEQFWNVIPDQPDFLVIVNDRAALVDPDTGQYYCNCPWLHVYRRGCYCGGI